jgi:hypothetical protein
VQARQKVIQCDEAGAATEDAIESCSQRQTPVITGLDLVNLKTRVEVPDQFAHSLLSGAMQIRECVQLMHQPFRMDPAQRVLANGELSGIVA